MKKLLIIFNFIFISLIFVTNLPYQTYCVASSEKPMLAIIIDDFGGYDQSGVELMLSIDAPLTCAIMPCLENTESNTKSALSSGKEVIVHMPMQASVSLPQNWYGNICINNLDNKEQVYQKLNQAFDSIEEAKGFNIHIGSGACQHEQVMSHVYDYAISNDKFFVDSRTHLNTICEKVANNKNTLYLGRDEFLEPQGAKSYDIAKQHLLIGANLAKEKGYAIIIGHVGTHGGEQTAKAIKDSLKEIKDMGVEIVPLSTLYNTLTSTFISQKSD